VRGLEKTDKHRPIRERGIYARFNEMGMRIRKEQCTIN